MSKHTITVTQEDINDGKAGNCTLCPIALAAKRAFPDIFPVVGGYYLVLDSAPGTEDGELVDLPYEARQFVQSFDFGRPVEPFSFKVTCNYG
jgi:hypothetical protein